MVRINCFQIRCNGRVQCFCIFERKPYMFIIFRFFFRRFSASVLVVMVIGTLLVIRSVQSRKTA